MLTVMLCCSAMSSDYITDTSSVLEQAVRILQAMVDVTAEAGWLTTAFRVMNLAQMVRIESNSNQNTP